MENNKRTKLISVLLIILCLSLCVGATYAYFTDSVTSNSNIIKSGKLDVTMEWANGTTDPANASWTDASTGAIFNYDLWEPGYTDARHIRIKNVGTLAFQYKLVIVANGEVTDLADVIDVYYFDPAEQIVERSNLTADKKLGTLTQALAGMDQTANGTLLAGESVTITIALKMQEDAGNKYQELSIGTDFSIQLYATQYTYESDAFDENYDAGACLHPTTKQIVDPEPTADKHGQKNTVCTQCGEILATEDLFLTFEKSSDESYYIVTGTTADFSGTELVIPATYNSLPVKEIGDSAFYYCRSLTGVTIPNSIITIGDSAFEDCYNLTDVTIPNSVTTIGNSAFYNCSGLTEIIIPDSVTTIGNSAFSYCRSLTEITIPNSITTIGDSTFHCCYGLTEITIPDSVTTIGDSAFEDCNNATELTIGNSVTTIGDSAFSYCSGLTEVTIPDSVTTIGEYAFASCGELLSVTLGENLSSIGNRAFYGCYRLVQVYDLSTSLTVIEGSGGNGYVGRYAYGVFTSADVVSKLWTDENGYIFYEEEEDDERYLVSHENSRVLLPLPADCHGKSYAINRYAFDDRRFGAYDSDMCESITIHNNITYIGEYAFDDNSNVGLVFFENTGWKCRETGYDENFEIPLSESELADPIIAAKYLLSEYNWCRWTNYTPIYSITYTFETNGGNTIDNIESNTGIILPTPSREGYTFVGWYDNAELTGVALTSPYCNSSSNLYAKWITSEEASAFEQATNLMFNQKYIYEFAAKGEKVYYAFTPEKSGMYTFFSNNWWNINGYICNTDKMKISSLAHYYSLSSISYPLKAGETYYFVAECTSNYEEYDFDITVSAVVTYTFNTNGGDAMDPYTTGKGMYPGIPYKEGTIFADWYDNAEFTGTPITSVYRSTTDCTLYAKWLTPEDVAELATVMDPNHTYTTNTTIGGQKGYYAIIADKSGYYKFVLSGDLSIDIDLYEVDLIEIDIDKDTWDERTSISFTQYLTAGETYYAVVTFGFGIETGTFNVTVIAPTAYKFETNEGKAIEDIVTTGSITLPMAYKDGAIFAGWYDNAELTGQALMSPYSSANDCTLYAKWMTKEECVDQAIVIESNRTYTANVTSGGQKFIYAFTPNKSEIHVFTINSEDFAYGYIYDSQLKLVEYRNENEDGFSTPIYLTAGETYYLVAKFISDVVTGSLEVKVGAFCTYSFDTKGGEPMESISSATGVYLRAPSREGYVFAGWYSNEACEGEALTSPYTSTSDCTLYAKWTTEEELFTQATIMTLNIPCDGNITVGGQKVYYKFTSETGGSYTFSASGNYDTYGCLYDSNRNQLAYNDDYNGSNFSITHTLAAGETYYLVVRFYSNYTTGTFDVIVTQND